MTGDSPLGILFVVSPMGKGGVEGSAVRFPSYGEIKSYCSRVRSFCFCRFIALD